MGYRCVIPLTQEFISSMASYLDALYDALGFEANIFIYLHLERAGQ